MSGSCPFCGSDDYKARQKCADCGDCDIGILCLVCGTNEMTISTDVILGSPTLAELLGTDDCRHFDRMHFQILQGQESWLLQPCDNLTNNLYVNSKEISTIDKVILNNDDKISLKNEVSAFSVVIRDSKS